MMAANDGSDNLARLAQFSTDRAVDAVFWVSPTAEILYVNDAACSILGYSRDELVGKTVPDIDPHFPKDGWPEHWAELQRRGSFTFESDHWTKDRRLLKTEVTVNYIVHEGREYNCAIMRDITARKQTEEQLSKRLKQLGILNALSATLNESSEVGEAYRATLDGFHQAFGIDRMAILVTDREGVRRFVAWRGLSEQYRRAVEGHTFWTQNDPAPLPVVYANIEDDPAMAPFRSMAIDEGIRALAAVPLVVRHRVIGKCMLYFPAPHRLSDEDLGFAQTIARTAAFAIERQRASTEVWTSSNLLRAVVEATPDSVFVKDLHGRYLLFNPSGAAFVGRSAAGVIGLDATSLFPGDEARTLMEKDRQVIADRKTRTSEDHLTTVDGQRRTFLSTKGPLFDEAGNVYGLFGIARDITEHKAAERKLQRSESRFRSLIHNSSDITTVLSAEAVVLYESPAFYRAFGWTEAQVIGRNAFQLVHPDDREHTMKVFAAALAAPGEVHTAQFRFRKADDTYVLLEAVGQSQLDDPDISGIVVNSRDVTERHRLAEQLRQGHKMEAIGRLAGGIAHDFNNLLTVINGYSELVLGGRDLSNRLRKPVEEIRRAGQRAAQLTNQLLTFGRQRVSKPTAVDLNTTVLNLTIMLPRLIGEHIQLKTSLDPDAGHVTADGGQLEQVVMNLAINARDAMPDGGTLTIETSAHVRSPLISLTVRDTGHGMDADTLSRIFEPFYTTKEPGHGTGLGLATVYGIVSQSGGTIEVSSTPGLGTTFVVSFPRAETPHADPEAAGAETSVPFGSETILLVEDEMMVRVFARDVLAARGYRVLEASSGEEALQLYASDDEPIDLLLTDIVMPGINGRELAERMIAVKPDVKVLFMSGYTEDASLRSAMWQAVSLLQKPFGVEALEREVRQTLDREPDSRL
jgi:PAS domain S-box-containing protein